MRFWLPLFIGLMAAALLGGGCQTLPEQARLQQKLERAFPVGMSLADARVEMAKWVSQVFEDDHDDRYVYPAHLVEPGASGYRSIYVRNILSGGIPMKERAENGQKQVLYLKLCFGEDGTLILREYLVRRI